MRSGPNGPTLSTLAPHERAAIYALVFVIVLADALTAAGIVVGILLGVPILLSSAGDSPRDVIAVGLISAVGFILAAIFGRGPISPEAVWLPNRLFAIVAIVASGILALILQRRRMEADMARIEAESSRDLSRLLHSLMAHDLRSPLALARDTLAAVEQPLRSGLPVDLQLIADADARLGRSLRAIEMVLDSARRELEPRDPNGSPVPLVNVAREIAEEIAAFDGEARNRAKELRVQLPRGEAAARVEPAVLRQSIAILVDNAIRYAVPGPIWIAAAIESAEVRVSVRDSGPGLSRGRARVGGSGAGLGLKLCELLAHRAGGRLDVARDDEHGTEFVLRLPAQSDA